VIKIKSKTLKQHNHWY